MIIQPDERFNPMTPYDATWHHTTQANWQSNWVNIGEGLATDSTMPLTDPILTDHQQCCSIHLWVISQDERKTLCFKFVHLKSESHLPGTNELKLNHHNVLHLPFYIPDLPIISTYFSRKCEYNSSKQQTSRAELETNYGQNSPLAIFNIISIAVPSVV